MGTRIYQRNDLKFPVDNFFDIENPTAYDCVVSNYQASLSRLEISVALNPGFKVVHKIVFSGVEYMNLLTRWKGANFCVAQPEDCVELARSIERYKDMPLDGLLRFFTLYVVDVQNFQLRILAGSGEAYKS